MLTIWKFPLVQKDEQTVTMPAGSEILSVQVQEGDVCAWALVNPAARKVDRRFLILGTGEPASHVSIEAVFAGTVQLNGGSLVLHVFVNPEGA